MNRRSFLSGLSRSLTAGFLLSPTAISANLHEAGSAVHTKRFAYIVGNTDYRHLSSLRNPSNDATALALALENVGFDVFGGGPRINLSNSELYQEVAEFSRLVDTHSAALFYYAGHGFQWESHNFLAGTDTSTLLRPPDRGALDRGTAIAWNSDRTELPVFSVDRLFHRMNQCSSALNIIILDACRNNPFPEDTKFLASLAKTDAPTRTLISYSTQPGNVALDGEGENSPYTDALVRAMTKPDTTILEVFNNTGLAVQEETNGIQVPWVSLSPIPSRLAFSDAFTRTGADTPPSEVCPDSIAHMQAPIRRLFAAWTHLDIALYEAQWSTDAFQVAGKIQRNRSGIFRQRRRFFPRLESVSVESIRPVFLHREGNIAMFRNTYTMVFRLRSGRIIRESEILETYTTVCAEDGKWLIKENFDYLDPSA